MTKDIQTQTTKTQEELLQELVNGLAPVATLAQYYIDNINNDLAKNKIIEDYIKAQKEEASEDN